MTAGRSPKECQSLHKEKKASSVEKKQIGLVATVRATWAEGRITPIFWIWVQGWVRISLCVPGEMGRLSVAETGVITL
jgi:hypothetical protein